MARRCWRWDSNPQKLALNGLRFRRVCQFRHASTQTTANLGNPKAETPEIGPLPTAALP